MKKIISMVTVIAMIMCAVYTVPLRAGAEDALTISTAEELKAFADSVNGGNTYEGKTVTLANDIDLSTVCGKDINGEEVSWTPIGDGMASFDGTFNGGGNTISGLYIHADGGDLGLFGLCGEGSQILNLIVDGSVTMSCAAVPPTVSGIANCSEGKIVNCHNKTDITGLGSVFAAGICIRGKELKNCINTGVISSESRTAAIAAWGADNIDNCYYLEGTAENGSGATAKTAEQFASGEVAYLLGDAWGQRIGVDEYPMIGGDKVYLVDGKYMNVPDSRYGRIVGKCHPAGATLKLYKGTNDAIAETIADSNGNYAFENLEPGNNYAISCDKTGYLPTRLEKLVVIAGETTEANISTSVGDSTIVISNAQELKDFADRVNSGKIYTAYKYDIVLENDIDLSEICGEDINGESVSWIPIGTPEHPFTGYFNGDNHTISGLYIDWEASNADELTNYRGLFGYAGAGSSIYDLTLEGTVNGGGAIFLQRPPASSKSLYIGSIAGYSEGNLINCHNKAEVIYGGNYASVGGVIGVISGEGAYVNDCSNLGAVNSSIIEAGGIVGSVENRASVKSCWSACAGDLEVCRNVDVENGASVTDCYYLADADNRKGGKDAEQFASGEVAYLLGSPWGQKIGVDEYPVYDGDAVYLIDGKYTNAPKKVVTVAPPTVNIPSGEVPYGTKVTISPTNGNQFQYKVNGGKWINPYVVGHTTDAVITITEDTTLVVKSLIDVVEENTEYVFPEETYTYTIGGSVVPVQYPYTINSLKLVSASGEEYDEIPTDTSFIVDMDVTKIADRSGQDYFIVATYDENNALVSMNHIKADLPTGTSFSCGVNIQKSDTPIASIKAFVWDALGTMTPLAQTRTISSVGNFAEDRVLASIYDVPEMTGDAGSFYLNYLNEKLPELDLKYCVQLMHSSDNAVKPRGIYMLGLNTAGRQKVYDAIELLKTLDVVEFASPDYVAHTED